MMEAEITIVFKLNVEPEHYLPDEIDPTEEEISIAVADDIVNNPEEYVDDIAEADVTVELKYG